MKLTLEQLCQKLGLQFSGNSQLAIDHVCSHDHLNSHGIAYCLNSKVLKSYYIPEDAVMIVPPGVMQEKSNLIFAENPLEIHIEITRLFHKPPFASGSVHPAAFVGDNVILGARGVITKDTADNSALAGFPAIPHIRWKRNLIILSRFSS